MVKCKHCGAKMSVLSIDAQTEGDDPEEVEVHIDIICENCDAGLTLSFDDGDLLMESPPGSFDVPKEK